MKADMYENMARDAKTKTIKKLAQAFSEIFGKYFKIKQTSESGFEYIPPENLNNFFLEATDLLLASRQTVDVENLQVELSDYFMMLQAVEKLITHDDENVKEIINGHLRPCEKCEGLEYKYAKYRETALARIDQLQAEINKLKREIK